MVKSPGSFEAFEASISSYGLAILGALTLEEQHCPENMVHFAGKSALLVGNKDRAMWSWFSAGPEFHDKGSDPLNRWTKRVVDEIVSGVGSCDTYYPFDKPYWPFQRIAQTASGVKPSPLGILIHPEFGLWHALRAIVIFEANHAFSNQINVLSLEDKKMIHPCDSCVDKPCLHACPVSAFSGTSLEVHKCFSHLDSGDDPRCLEDGCRSRDACPVGAEHRYDPQQVRFHMKSYRGR